MIALIRKDLPWLLGFAIGGVVVHLAALALHGVLSVWIVPDEAFTTVTLFVFGVVGTVMGVTLNSIDHLTETRDYLVHRPVSIARLFWTRQIGAFAVLLVWAFVPVTLHLGGSLVLFRNADLIDHARWGEFVLAGAPALLFYGQGAFWVTFARRPIVGIVLAGLGSLFTLVIFDTWPALVAIIPLVSVAGAAVFLVGAQLNERGGRDLDLPMPAWRLIVGAGTAISLLSLFSSFLLHSTQTGLRWNLLERYPILFRTDDGRVALKRFERSLNRTRAVVVDEKHDPIGAKAKSGHLKTWLWSPTSHTVGAIELAEHSWIGRRHGIGNLRYQYIPCMVEGQACYWTSNGFFLTVPTKTFPGQRRGWVWFGKGRDGRTPFSRRAEPLSRFGRLVLVGDPEDGSVWTIDPGHERPQFRRIDLPGGDRFVHVISWFHAVGTSAVRGELGDYVYDPSANRFQIAPGKITESFDRNKQWRAWQESPNVLVDERGAFTFGVTVPASDGNPAHVHRYAPYTPVEKGYAAGAVVLSMVRAPLLVAAGVFASERGGVPHGLHWGPLHLQKLSRASFVDPLVQFGSRWIVFANGCFCLVLAALAFRRLGRLSATSKRRWGWAIAVLLGGAPAFVVFRCVETNRAWRSFPDSATPRPVLIATRLHPV